MTQAERELVFEVLMHSIPRDGSPAEREIADVVTRDIDRLEPIIEQIVKDRVAQKIALRLADVAAHAEERAIRKFSPQPEVQKEPAHA